MQVEKEDDATEDALSPAGEPRHSHRRAYAVLGLVILVAAAVLFRLRYPSHPAGDAATVNGLGISHKAINQDLADLSANPQYVQLVNQGSSGPVAGSTPGTYNKSFVAALLDQQIRFEIIRQKLVASHVRPDARQLAAARTSIDQTFPAGIFAAFPARYRTLLAAQQAESDAFVKVVTDSLTGDDVSTYYQSHLNDYATDACVRHILIADKGSGDQIDFVASLADARKVKGQLDAGGDFAGVARQYSTDNQGATGGSAAQGGTLSGSRPDGCLSSADLKQLVTEFSQAVVSLPVNVVSDPVKSPFGYHLIEVTKRTIEPLDTPVTTDIDTRIAGQRLNQLIAQAKVSVDPALGTFDRKADPATGLVRGVVPPVSAGRIPVGG
jgi:parvulin-like peptidyl-prolyl isomerase